MYNMYTGEVDLSNQSGENIFGLLVASDQLILEELFKHVQDHLIEKQPAWVQQNFVPVFHAAFKLSNSRNYKNIVLNPSV